MSQIFLSTYVGKGSFSKAGLNYHFQGKDRLRGDVSLWGLKSLASVIIVGLILFSGSTLLVEGQEKAKDNFQELESSFQDESVVTNNQSVLKTPAYFPSPIAGKPLRLPGETYSEELDMMLFHSGTDYAQAEGAVIRVKHEGKITYAGPDPILGHKVEVDCGDDWRIVYGGLKNLRVREGDWLEVDEAIGQIGYYPDIYGDIEQTHLHYEIWQGDLLQVPISSSKQE